ncbi:MAG: acetate/propionate family kinase, partial [Wenzhouxiangellaceae bacterium]
MKDISYLLIFNAGSSSLKFGVYEYSDELNLCLRGAVRDIGRSSSTLYLDDQSGVIDGVTSVTDAAAVILTRLADGVRGIRLCGDNVAATGHRVVHGAENFVAATRLDASSLEQLQAIEHLAPLHNPYSLAVVRKVEEVFPGVPAIAEFDTAFFHDLPETARSYAIPRELSSRYAIRRYGFHGIAHQYMSRTIERSHQGSAAPTRVISLHLGQGCSVAALCDGRPVETSMGFTPLEGLIMGTRTGDIDAGVVLYLARQGLSW